MLEKIGDGKGMRFDDFVGGLGAPTEMKHYPGDIMLATWTLGRKSGTFRFVGLSCIGREHEHG